MFDYFISKLRYRVFPVLVQIIYYCTIFAMIIYLRVTEIGPRPVPVWPAPPIVD
eukprot:SAG31_NODE_20608_length_569_cov_1.582979_1_plen_54_part_00